MFDIEAAVEQRERARIEQAANEERFRREHAAQAARDAQRVNESFAQRKRESEAARLDARERVARAQVVLEEAISTRKRCEISARFDSIAEARQAEQQAVYLLELAERELELDWGERPLRTQGL